MFDAMPETRTVEVPYGALCQAAGVLDGLTRALENAARYGPGFSASAAQDAATLRKLRAELLTGQPDGHDRDAEAHGAEQKWYATIAFAFASGVPGP
jgi:hypothetical protein